MTKTQIESAIAAALKPVLIGTDEGTHQGPDHYRIYESISGHRFAMMSRGGSNEIKCTQEEAEAETQGRIRRWNPTPAAERQQAINALRADLARAIAAEQAAERAANDTTLRAHIARQAGVSPDQVTITQGFVGAPRVWAKLPGQFEPVCYVMR